jgi:two-component system sensor histidine kinase YesM
VGFDPAVLEQINQNKSASNKEFKTGIGLLNVKKRLEINYGEAADFRIDSVPNEGTSISISLPCQKGGDRA